MRAWRWMLVVFLAFTFLSSGVSLATNQKKTTTTKKKAPPKKTTKKKPTAKKSDTPPAPTYVPRYAPNEVKPAIPQSAEDEIVFIGVGDIMMGSTYPDESGGRLPPDGGAKVLEEVTPFLLAADIAFGNLEGPLIDGGETKKCSKKSTRCYAFRSPTSYGKHFKDAGFDIMSLANNHAGDFGADGRASTKKVLDDQGILHSGEPGDIARLVSKGKKVSLIAFATSPATYNLTNIEEAVKVVSDEAATADIVIVSFHGGAEGAGRQHVPQGQEMFAGENRGDLRVFSHAVIDAGADLVIGHGPHVMRGLELYKDRLIAYSLGNFATYGGMNLNGPNGLTAMLEVHLNLDGSFKAGQLHPGKQARPGGPKLDPKGEVIPVMQDLSKEDFGTSAVKIGDDGSLSKP